MYSIALSSDGRYVDIVVTGTIDRRRAMQINLEAHTLGQARGVRRYLLDLTDARNTDTVVGNYNFAYKAMQQTPGIDLDAIVAVVTAPGDTSHDFVKVTAHNAGLRTTFFTDREQAIAHLVNQ